MPSSCCTYHLWSGWPRHHGRRPQTISHWTQPIPSTLNIVWGLVPGFQQSLPSDESARKKKRKKLNGSQTHQASMPRSVRFPLEERKYSMDISFREPVTLQKCEKNEIHFCISREEHAYLVWNSVTIGEPKKDNILRTKLSGTL